MFGLILSDLRPSSLNGIVVMVLSSLIGTAAIVLRAFFSEWNCCDGPLFSDWNCCDSPTRANLPNCHHRLHLIDCPYPCPSCGALSSRVSVEWHHHGAFSSWVSAEWHRHVHILFLGKTT